MKICSVEECDRTASRRGWCTKHYSRWLRHGDPLFTKTAGWGEGQNLLETWIKTRSRDGCWDDWPFGSGGEYPSVGRNQRASHAVLELDGLPRPEFPNNNALHSCDNKLCVNPDHLRWGTKEDNAKDYAERWGYCPHCDHCNGDK